MLSPTSSARRFSGRRLMLPTSLSHSLPLPRGWPRRVRSAVVQVISLARTSLALTQGWASESMNEPPIFAILVMATPPPARARGSFRHVDRDHLAIGLRGGPVTQPRGVVTIAVQPRVEALARVRRQELRLVVPAVAGVGEAAVGLSGIAGILL